MNAIKLRLLATLIVLLGLSAYANAASELRISAEQLADLQQRTRVVLLDARTPEEFNQGHIPGARNLPFKRTFQNLSKNGLVLASDHAKALLSSIGLKNGDDVIVYDGSNMIQAARVFWMLEMYGHENVRLLDGGLKAWQSAGLPLTQDTSPIAISDYAPNINRGAIKTWADVQDAVKAPDNYVIIDARDGEHFAGLKSEAHRFGHIPTARNIPVNKNLTGDGRLRSIDELKSLYGNIPENKKVIVYCSKGLASSLEYLVLRELDLNVGNYESSWMEWGNRDELSIVNPTAASDTELKASIPTP